MGAAEPFAQCGHGEEGREDRLDLQDERGQAGGHPQVHAGEQEPELAHAEDQSDGDDPPPPDLWPPDEEDGRHGGGEEAQGGEEQWREVVQADVDDDEVDAPYGGDENGEGEVQGTHTSQPRRPDSVAPAQVPS
ncbi:hypothetical protein GCM10010324_13240 [Streptomyces hiroshimensis]|uniref:Uncharacterized protein n=1 Tax=Streptomyces hiroshimensis TaxID=66424 RepID=A0ABQ2Y8H7_9ACTN|nr:hypothetical protein GCM10010324_13240 [Streptomyces hiroshimensis]